MNTPAMLLNDAFCRTLIVTLVHTLWQGLLIAGGLYALLRAIPAGTPNKRYGASLIGLAAIMLCGLFTWSILNYVPQNADDGADMVAAGSEAAPHSPPEAAASGGTPPETRTLATGTEQASTGIQWHVWLTAAWALGAATMLLRAVAVVAGGGRLRGGCRLVEDHEITGAVERLRERMGIRRRIRVVGGEHIAVPGVIGCLWPTLLLPVSMLGGLPPDDLKAILAHELAHIRRFDYLVNLCQMVIEALLFFNPAVWWVSRQVRIEREACCDAAAVAVAGQAGYATALVSWLGRLREQRTLAAAALIGLADGRGSGQMLDRIRRIIIAGHRPKLRVSWPAAVAVIMLSVLGLIALQCGTDLAVALAGRVLTPEERIETISAISKDYGFDGGTYGEEHEVMVSGIVRTYDGGPLPRYPHLLVRSERPSHSASTSISLSKDNQPEGTATFRHRAEYGRIYVMADADGYAPAFAGPFDPEPAETVEEIELVLREGFPGRILVVDEGGRPVEDAKIVGGYTYPDDGSYHHTIKLTTDSDGLAKLEHAAEHPATLQIDRDGFEPEQVKGLLFKPHETTEVTLRAAVPATGIVRSETTGDPIPGANIRVMLSRIGNHSYGENGMHGEPEAITDADGRFGLTALRGDREYLILVRAEGYGHRYVSGVRAGQDRIEVELGPRKAIHGTITGDLDRLREGKDGTPQVSFWNNYRLGNHSSSDSHETCPVRIRDGVGLFEISDFYGQTVHISAGGKRVSVDVTNDDLENVLIELSPEKDIRRDVVLVFGVPEGSPPMQGGIRIDTIQEGDRGYKPDWLEVVDGRARCRVPVPCRFKYGVDYHRGKRPVGYWIKESDPIDIPAGEEPFTIEVPVHPAGAIYGKILQPNGAVAANASASLLVTRRPEIVGSGLHDLGNALYGPGLDRGRFNATPLPLGGEYVIVGSLNNYFRIAGPLLLDRAHQIVPQDITLGEGIPLRGRLLDFDGAPARDLVRLRVRVKLGQANWSTNPDEVRPDENGWFVFENVNPEFAGRYSFSVEVRPGYRPARLEVEDLRRAQVIRLERGRRLAGVVIHDATGRPVPRAEVYAYYHETKGEGYEFESLDAESPTNEQGEFVFSNMAARQYRINVRSANLAAPSRFVTATGGQDEPVMVRITIPEHSNLEPAPPQRP